MSQWDKYQYSYNETQVELEGKSKSIKRKIVIPSKSFPVSRDGRWWKGKKGSLAKMISNIFLLQQWHRTPLRLPWGHAFRLLWASIPYPHLFHNNSSFPLCYLPSFLSILAFCYVLRNNYQKQQGLWGNMLSCFLTWLSVQVKVEQNLLAGYWMGVFYVTTSKIRTFLLNHWLSFSSTEMQCTHY